MYDREKVEAQCLEAIEKEGVVFFNELAEFVAPAMSTLYEWELEKSESLKNAIEKNRVKAKRKLRRNWVKDDAAPVLQLAAYKLMADKTEIDALTMNRQDINHSGTGIQVVFKPAENYETK